MHDHQFVTRPDISDLRHRAREVVFNVRLTASQAGARPSVSARTASTEANNPAANARPCCRQSGPNHVPVFLMALSNLSIYIN